MFKVGNEECRINTGLVSSIPYSKIITASGMNKIVRASEAGVAALDPLGTDRGVFSRALPNNGAIAWNPVTRSTSTVS